MPDLQYLDEVMKSGIMLHTSGSTGARKAFYQTPGKLQASNRVALESQCITKNSRIYTVCRMQHAGGLLAQTLPAHTIGAHIEIEVFNAFTWVRRIREFTHTHITPNQGAAIIKTKGFAALDLSGIWVTCGSDPVPWHLIEAFVARGAIFMANWGMTEIGPIAINATFKNIDSVMAAKALMPDTTVLGKTKWCESKILDGMLHVRGDISVFGAQWYATGDMVKEHDGGYISFVGRMDTD